MIRAVLFDLDRTLLDRDTSFAAFARDQYRRFAPAFAAVDESAYVERLVALDARGHVRKDVVYRTLVADLALAAPLADELNADFERHIAAHYVPFPGLREMLTTLAAGHRLGLVTNGRGDFQQRTIDTLGIAPFFSAILISEREGVRKPDPEIFRRALARLDCAAADAVYVGDNPDADIRAARAAGLRAIWKRNAAFPEPPCDGIINDLAELPSRLRTLNNAAPQGREAGDR